jgi:hypothetical protein
MILMIQKDSVMAGTFTNQSFEFNVFKGEIFMMAFPNALPRAAEDVLQVKRDPEIAHGIRHRYPTMSNGSHEGSAVVSA